VKASREVCEYCDDRRNREEILELFANRDVGSAPEYTFRPGFIDPSTVQLAQNPAVAAVQPPLTN